MKRMLGLLVALMLGVLSLEARDVYYVDGYFGTAGADGAKLRVKDATGAFTDYQVGDTVVIRRPECVVSEAWLSAEGQVPRLIRIETDFIFHSGVSTEILGDVTIAVAEGVKLTVNRKTASQNAVHVGASAFDGAGTVDLSGVQSLASPITVSTQTALVLPTNWAGELMILDPENLDLSKYPGFEVSVVEGKTYLVRPVARVDGNAYDTFEKAFEAARPTGTIEVLVIPTTGLPAALTDAAQWTGAVRFSGTLPNGFNPALYGNASSTVEFNGMAGGYLAYQGRFSGTLKLTNGDSTPAWSAGNGYSSDNFVFGALTGDGDFVDVNGGVTQQYSFREASGFRGGITTMGKRIVFGTTAFGTTASIHVESGFAAVLADGRTWTASRGIYVDGVLRGGGTLASATAFGNTATLDLSAGVPQAAATVTLGSKLTLWNVQPGGTVLKTTTVPVNLENVALWDDAGTEQTDWRLVFDAARGAVKLMRRTPSTLYWSAWRGTFWEPVGSVDVYGNRGLMRDGDGHVMAFLPGDTIVFDRAHYVDGQGAFAEQTDFWHYDENLYISHSIEPGTAAGGWDIKVLEGVTLKLGLRGTRAGGQNVPAGFRLFIAEGSALELGYWGNTHHYQGLIRHGAVLGGRGTIYPGDDFGPSLRLEGDVFGGDAETGTPTLDMRGRELLLAGKAEGARTDVCLPLRGVGEISAQNDNVHLTDAVDFGNTATIDARAHLLACDAAVTVGDSISVRLDAAPEGDEAIKVLSCGAATLGAEGTAVRVWVGASAVPDFFELVQGADGLYVRRKAGTAIVYSATARLGYDYRTMRVDAVMTPAVEGVVVTVELLEVDGAGVASVWTGTLDAAGQCTVLVGDEDNLLEPNKVYRARVSVAGTVVDTVACFVGWPAEVGDHLAEVDGVKYGSLRAAVAASRRTGGTIRLLTNVFFAPYPGEFPLERAGHDIRMVNDMRLDGTHVTAPATVDHYDNGAADESARFNFSLDGEWLGWALPWRTRKQIQTALLAPNEAGTMTRWQAYALGFAANAEVGADEVEQARALVCAGPEDEKGTFHVRDDRLVRDARLSGVDVVRTLLRQNPKNGTFEPMTDVVFTDDGFAIDVEVDEANVGRYRIGYDFSFEQKAEAGETGP